MHPWLKLGEQGLELKPAELISWKQRWQEPDYGVSLQPARPARALPSPADQRLMQSSCLFPSLSLLSHMHITRTHLQSPQAWSPWIPSCHLTRGGCPHKPTHSKAWLWRRTSASSWSPQLPNDLNQDIEGDYDTVCHVDLPDHGLYVVQISSFFFFAYLCRI